MGVAVMDVSGLAPGSHEMEMRFARHPAYRDRVVRL
jgi:hypothetical protein